MVVIIFSIDMKYSCEMNILLCIIEVKPIFEFVNYMDRIYH